MFALYVKEAQCKCLESGRIKCSGCVTAMEDEGRVLYSPTRKVRKKKWLGSIPPFVHPLSPLRSVAQGCMQ